MIFESLIGQALLIVGALALFTLLSLGLLWLFGVWLALRGERDG